MILTDEQIIAACTQERDGSLIEPFEQSQVQPEMMRTLEALVTATKNLEDAVKNLEKTVNWCLPIMTGIILAVIMVPFTAALALLVK